MIDARNLEVGKCYSVPCSIPLMPAFCLNEVVPGQSLPIRQPTVGATFVVLERRMKRFAPWYKVRYYSKDVPGTPPPALFTEGWYNWIALLNGQILEMDKDRDLTKGKEPKVTEEPEGEFPDSNPKAGTVIEEAGSDDAEAPNDSPPDPVLTEEEETANGKEEKGTTTEGDVEEEVKDELPPESPPPATKKKTTRKKRTTTKKKTTTRKKRATKKKSE